MLIYMEAKHSDIIQSFAALGDPTRFSIVDRLRREGELTAGTLVEGTDLSAAAVSRHLKVLNDAGLVSRRVDKQRRMYSVSETALDSIQTWTVSPEEFWTVSLDQLGNALAEFEAEMNAASDTASAEVLPAAHGDTEGKNNG